MEKCKQRSRRASAQWRSAVGLGSLKVEKETGASGRDGEPYVVLRRRRHSRKRLYYCGKKALVGVSDKNLYRT